MLCVVTLFFSVGLLGVSVVILYFFLFLFRYFMYCIVEFIKWIKFIEPSGFSDNLPLMLQSRRLMYFVYIKFAG